MLKDLYEKYEEDSDSEIELTGVKDVHYELIHESIADQVKDPFVTQVNFMEEYFDSIDQQKKINGENPEIAEELRQDTVTFCKEVIAMINEKFQLDIEESSLDELSDDNIKNFAMALYEFFITNYPKNIKKFFIKYIIAHIDDIANVLSEFKNKTDVVTTSLKEKLKDERQAIIMSNLKKVVEYIDSLDLDGMELLSVFNQDRWDVYTLTEAMEDMLIGDTFVHTFFYPLMGEYDDENHENVMNGIASGLLNKFMKE
jgi:hypothetical protein